MNAKPLPKFYELPKIKKIQQQFNNNITKQKSIKILFLLQLNKRNSRQINRLLKLIYRPNHLYYIHVDINEHYMFNGK